MEKFTEFYKESMERMEAEEMKKVEIEEWKVKTIATQVCEGEEQQHWYKCVRKEVGLNTKTLGAHEWPYGIEIECLMEESEGRIASNVPLFMYLT
jgi:hypothetical protein